MFLSPSSVELKGLDDKTSNKGSIYENDIQFYISAAT